MGSVRNSVAKMLCIQDNLAPLSPTAPQPAHSPTIEELQQRLSHLALQKATLESAMEISQERIFNNDRRQIAKWPSFHARSSSVSSVGLIESLKANVKSLRIKLANTERDLVASNARAQIYRKELVLLRQKLGMPIDDLADEIKADGRQRSQSVNSAVRGQPGVRSISSPARRVSQEDAVSYRRAAACPRSPPS